MTKQKSLSRKLLSFFVSEHNSDALRNTLAIVVPGLVVFYMGYLEVAIAIGVGTLLSSLTDTPGNPQDKWQSASWCVPLFWTTSLVTAGILAFPAVLLVWLVFIAFLFTMLSVYGARMASIGLLSLVLATFTLGLWPGDAWHFSLCIAAGAALYYTISIVQAYIDPYRSLRYAMADGFQRAAVLLQAKAQCYDDRVPIEKAYRQLGALHIRVSEQQETIRFLLLREKTLADDPRKGRYGLDHIIGLTDLYELLTALDHDYDYIRKVLGPTGVLARIRQIIVLMSREVDSLSWRYTRLRRLPPDRTADIRKLLQELTSVKDARSGEEARVLAATVRNVDQILNCIHRIRSSSQAGAGGKDLNEKPDYGRFLALPPTGWRALFAQLSFKTAVFPFALRLAVLFGVGGICGILFLPEYRYAYWILLTLAVVARPTFATTQQRNSQRLLGTVGGILLGLLVIFALPDATTALALAALFLYGFFLFNRTDYMWSVFSLTVAVIIALNTYEGHITDILGSRLAFTLIGSGLAILGWYFIPVRQSRGILAMAEQVVKRNEHYFLLIKKRMEGGQIPMDDLRLGRKQAHTSLAAFSDTIRQLRQEPGHRRWNWTIIHEFHALSYRVNSLIIGTYITLSSEEGRNTDLEHFGTRISAIESLLTGMDSLRRQFSKNVS